MRWSRDVQPADLVELDAGHPLEGRTLRAEWVRWTREDGRVRWVYRVSWEG